MGDHAGGRAAGGGNQPSDRAGPNYRRVSRAGLLAGASVFALAALGASGVARAACDPSPQIIATPVSGPIVSNGGAITVTGSGSISGGPGGDGVDALTCPITTLSNQSGGTISGGAGRAQRLGRRGRIERQYDQDTDQQRRDQRRKRRRWDAPAVARAARGRRRKGATVGSLINQATGTISGGNGGVGGTSGAGAGGAGVSNAGTVMALTNSGAISGGGAGGAGVANSGTIIALTNTGRIGGGQQGEGSLGLTGGAGVLNSGTIGSSNVAGSGLNNSALIVGGAGGTAFGAGGGAGVAISGAITTLSNSGMLAAARAAQAAQAAAQAAPAFRTPPARRLDRSSIR